MVPSEGRPDDVVVVGGGVIGLASAWSLAVAGQRVTVVDPSPGRGASWVAAGMLAPVSEAHYGEEVLVEILVEGAARWPAFAAELEAASGSDVGYRDCGTVVVAADASDRSALEDLVALPRRLGLGVEGLSGRDCRRLVPALAPGIRGGAAVTGDHQVDNRRLVEALLTACQAAGVGFVAERLEAVEVGDGALRALRLCGGGRLVPGRALLALGARTATVAGLPEGTLPAIRPVKGHILRLRGEAASPLLPRTVRGLVHGRPCYLVPRNDGTLVVGATEEERGFDEAVQAGAVHDLLHDARTLVPGIDELELIEAGAGLRPGSPDNRPFVGWTDVVGLAVAAGHHRNGILLAPLTAEIVAGLFGAGALPAAAGALDPRRVVGS